MPFIDSPRLNGRRLIVASLALAVAACGSPSRTPAPAPAPAAPPVASPAPPVAAVAPPAPVAPAAAPAAAKTWNDFKVLAARKVVATNPQITHTGAVQQPALAIPVLEVELNADGTIRKIDVMRQPSQARETTQIAIDAVRRAAPFGGIAHLPKPWKFSEAFLFNDDKRFKPASLDR